MRGKLAIFQILLFVLCALTVGCNLFEKNPSGTADLDAKLGVISGNPSVAGPISFKIVMPEESTGSESSIIPSVRASGANEPMVTFKLTLFNAGNPISTLIKKVQVDVASRSANVTFSNVPAVTCMCNIHIEGGKVGVYSNFHGASDLLTGAENTIYVSPKGSKTKYDVIAQVIQNLIDSQDFLLLSGRELVGKITQAIVGIDLNSTTVYETATNQTSEQLASGLFIWASPFVGCSYWNGQDLKLTVDVPKTSDPVVKVEFFWAAAKSSPSLLIPHMSIHSKTFLV